MLSSKKYANLFIYTSMTRHYFQHPNASNRIIVRAKILSKGTLMWALTRNISDLGGILSAIDVVRPAFDWMIRDFSIDTEGVDHIQAILEMLQSQPGVDHISHSDRTFLIYQGVRSKFRIVHRWRQETVCRWHTVQGLRDAAMWFIKIQRTSTSLRLREIWLRW